MATVKRFASAGCDNLVKIWGFHEETQAWAEEDTLEGHTDWVRDVAWAPNIGLPRSYIATASQVRLNVHIPFPHILNFSRRIKPSLYGRKTRPVAHGSRQPSTPHLQLGCLRRPARPRLQQASSPTLFGASLGAWLATFWPLVAVTAK